MLNGSSGTGFSEPDILHVVCDNGYETDITVDIWYMPIGRIRDKFINGISKKINLDEDDLIKAFVLYVKEIAGRSCPYSVYEILSYYGIENFDEL